MIDMALQFFLEYTPEGVAIPESDLKKISWHYLNGDFKLDMLALIPFQFLQMKNNRQYLFFMIKLIRLEKGIRHISVPEMVNYFQNLNFEHIQKMIDSNDPSANDKMLDQTKITFVLML